MNLSNKLVSSFSIPAAQTDLREARDRGGREEGWK